MEDIKLGVFANFSEISSAGFSSFSIAKCDDKI